MNQSCEWHEEPSVLAGAGTRERSRHLEEDVRIAQDLGIRFGDSVGGRILHPPNLEAREACTERSFAEIMRIHDVSRGELESAVGARNIWLDLSLVFVPIALVLIVASRSALRSLAVWLDFENRWVFIIAIALITPVAAGAGVGFTQIWSVVVEEARLRSDHISYRAAYLPVYVHREIAWMAAGAIFLAVAAVMRRGKPG